MKKFMQWLVKHKKIITVVGTLVLLSATIYGYRAGVFTEQEKMQLFLQKSGIFAPLIFVIIQAVQVIIPILPGAVGCLYGVIIFGVWQGFVLNYIGICLGSVGAFFIARQFGQEFVLHVTGGKFYEKYSRYLLKENQFEKIFAILIFLPVAPDDFLCYLAGISKMPAKKFALIILLGKPAAIALYSLGLQNLFQLATGLFA
ncbi:MAG: TVP38/TMEM64 family protein [Lachnospiraceae bacterium]|nr:TVP38/TMEM64 family protein [Lachnospiraceae bacterium]